MQYRDVEYQVVQTASPAGWKWTVALDQNRSRTGSNPTRAAAIALAQRFIDTEFKKNQKARNPAHRRPPKQIVSLEQRLSAEAKRLRKQAQSLPHGILREQLLRKARQAEIGSHITEWLASPGLRAPQ